MMLSAYLLPCLMLVSLVECQEAGVVKQKHSHKDTTQVHKDTTKVHKDTTQVHKDTTQVHKDTTKEHKDTTQVHKDTTQVHKDTTKPDPSKWVEKGQALLNGRRTVETTCPGGTCPGRSTCCPLGSGEYACCPSPKAVCCEDWKHCCPRGFDCDLINGNCTRV